MEEEKKPIYKEPFHRQVMTIQSIYYGDEFFWVKFTAGSLFGFLIGLYIGTVL